MPASPPPRMRRTSPTATHRKVSPAETSALSSSLSPVRVHMAEDTLAALYEETRARIVALVKATGAGTAAASASAAVPACPGWTVHAVLSHVTALHGDVMAGNLACAGSD